MNLWPLQKAWYRSFQSARRIYIKTLHFPTPEILSGESSIGRLPQLLKKHQVHHVLIVTDQGISRLGLLDDLLCALKEQGIDYSVYDQVLPNPTVENIEEALQLYGQQRCEGVIGFGGGSPMDCAKMVAARAANPSQSIKHMRGELRIKNKPAPIFAVPTTAGTGSEVTIAAVVKDTATHEKYAITDLKLMPLGAVLDPALSSGLPAHITAATGMDALTHAVEAYIGRNGSEFTNEKARRAVRLIFEHLPTAYCNGTNMQARTNMLQAANDAGAAFTRAYVGYVHAIAHQLGGVYDVPHGLANAILLPYVLEYYENAAVPKLAELAIAGGIGTAKEPEAALAAQFIEHVRHLNKNMNIPSKVKELREQDIPLIAQRAMQEGNPVYPVPKIMSIHECKNLLKKLLQ